MRRYLFVLVPVLLIAIALASGCAKRQLTKSEMDRVSTIRAKIAEAQEMGAKECAPKELARTMATLDHGIHELEEGEAEGEELLNDADRMADDVLAKTKVCLDMKKKDMMEVLTRVTLTADPATIEKGQCSTLSWTVVEAETASIQGIGMIGVEDESGSREVCPPRTTTYTIEASGPTGPASASAMVTVVEPMPVPVVSFDNIYFDFDESFIRGDAKPVLEKLASYMKGHGDVRVLIAGHCDERGTPEYNFALGERRAQAAKNYLMDLGVDGKRIKTISYGEERPADPGHNEAAWAENRRDVFVIEK